MTELTIKDSDLVLQISPSYDIKKIDINKYEPFIDKLCWTREYQKEAIRKICIYLLWWRYQNLKWLAEENFSHNDFLKQKYWTIGHFLNQLHLSDKLSCNIDLATWTGKSYVMYGIAQILLCEWVIDRVLILCPSITIEEWLTKKFKDLSTDADLKRLLPNKTGIKNPRILQADKTIEAGDVCIENIHSTYKNTKSAIEDSLLHHWEKTLVLNDEAHHIYSKADKNVKKRKEFLEDEDYWFKYIVWFSGTPYIENDYFTDVIYRYSLLEAMEQKFVKKIDYVIEDTITKGNNYIKMQVIHQNHEKIKAKYHKIKPITIIISKDIEHCKKDRQVIIDYLIKELWYPKDKAEKEVLIVTSHSDHKDNIEILRKVHDSSNPVEWICSVAMLTEGWDVPNVFQIVPSEEKAFNSKLLISQVIGRWLRVPEEYKGEDLHVKVLNHVKFSDRIKHLVDEILERDDRIYSYPIKEKEKYNFDVYSLVYDRESKEEINTEKDGQYDFSKIKREGINISPEQEREEIKIWYEVMGTENNYEDELIIKRKIVSIDELAQQINNKLRAWDIEMETTYAEEYDFKTIKSIIEKSLKKRDTTIITEWIATKFLQAFGTLKRKSNKVLRYKAEAQDICKKNTQEIPASSLWLSVIKNKKGYVFYDEISEKYSKEEDKQALDSLKEEVGSKYLININNSYTFKTPFNLALVQNSTPEKDFIENLIKEKNVNIIDGWCKSKDKWFYELEFSWKRWEHTVLDHFNPDFFIKQGENIIVIEIKDNNSIKEYSRDFIRNKEKYFTAQKHFETLNEFLKEKKIKQKYFFHFCSPKDYWSLFGYLRNNNIDKYLSNLDEVFENTKLKETELKDIEIKQLDLFDRTELTKHFWANREKLEDGSRIFLITAEKNYQENRENKEYNFSADELTKTFELELRIKLFDKMRDDEDVALEILNAEESSWKPNKELISYFNYASDGLSLGAMENALRFNDTIKEHIKDNYSAPSFLINSSYEYYDLIKKWEYKKIDKGIYEELPNLIALLRIKYRNQSAHGSKVITKEDFEELREFLVTGEWILLRLVELLIK